MSEPRLISPMLDGFRMGAPISEHDGVCCCPAIAPETDERYIVKVISIPADQGKLDGLLLAGAFQGKEDAQKYFGLLADDAVREAALLGQLSQEPGFAGYDRWQKVQMPEPDTGWDVYLAAPYRKTLERFLRRNPMTHLAAVNLGLDICEALSACRRAGYLYVNLRPENICLTGDRAYEICDLGFIEMKGLSRASLPDRYISAYTAPEIVDAFSSPNATLDVYALGMILYKLYNGGVLPFEDRAPETALPSPAYADYEMAQIILKACDPSPASRYLEPEQMRQALVEYMQRNGADDTPILPPAATPEDLTPAEEPATQEDVGGDPSTADILAEVDDALTTVGVTPEKQEELLQNAPEPQAVPSDTASGEPSAEDDDIDSPFIEDVTGKPGAISAEVHAILNQADVLISHEPPAPVVAPEAIEVPIPAPLAPAFREEPEENSEDPSEDASQETEAEPSKEPPPSRRRGRPPRRENPLKARKEAQEAEAQDEDAPTEQAEPSDHRGLWLGIVGVLLAAILIVGGYIFYNHYYIQPIDGLEIQGAENHMTVTLKAAVPDELLTVVCTDSHGNPQRKAPENGVAKFTDLMPSTRYTVSLEISGFHKLVGVVSNSYTTPPQASIVDFTAAAGSEDGSADLRFTVKDGDSEEWKLTYSAEGEAQQSTTFSGHAVTVSGLTLGKTYTFRLEPVTELYIAGENTLTYTAVKSIRAQELAVADYREGKLIVTWKNPEDAEGQSWSVRCFNESGFDETTQVTGTEAAFAIPDAALSYTVEVTAEGGSGKEIAILPAGSICVSDMKVDASTAGSLSVTWKIEAQGDLLLYYKRDGVGDPELVHITDGKALIPNPIPGCTYQIYLEDPNGNRVFGGSCEYAVPEAKPFSGYRVKASNLIFSMCKTPSKENWVREDVPEADFTTEFAPGAKASFAIRVDCEYDTSPDKILTLLVIRDSEKRVVRVDTIPERTWTSMWYRGFGRLNLPYLPQEAGEYTIDIFFNGAFVTTQAFSIVD